MIRGPSRPPVANTLPLAEELQGETPYETRLLQTQLEQAQECLRSFAWCTELREQRFGVGLGGVLAVFLIEAIVKGREREWLWVIAGDLPSAYFSHERARDPCEALHVYCALVESWLQAVRAGGGIPVPRSLQVEPNPELARVIEAKLTTVRRIVLPVLCHPLAEGGESAAGDGEQGP